jgi:hypothetical protein
MQRSRVLVRTASATAMVVATLLGDAPCISAQFVTPIPTTQPASVLEPGRYQSRFRRALSAEQRDSVEEGTLNQSRLEELRASFCGGAGSAAQQESCRDYIDVDSIQTYQSLDPRKQGRTLLRLRPPGTHDRSALEEYLKMAAGPDGLSLFSRFAANVSNDEAYVTSDVISGLAGRMLFAVNYAAVVVKDESGTTEAEQREIESHKATVIRMVNNGGTLTGRFQFPMYAYSGPTSQTAASVYGTAGLIGPLGNTDSLKFAGSAVGELATALSIREISEAAGILGSLVGAVRFGYAFSESELLNGTGDKGFPFAQFAVGLLQSGKISLSALYTYPLEQRYRAFAPKLTVNFAAVR